jgi:hypothetical protein
MGSTIFGKDSAMSKNISQMLSEQRAQGEFSSIYLIIVFIIAALLIIAVVKPMFKQARDVAQRAPLINK